MNRTMSPHLRGYVKADTYRKGCSIRDMARWQMLLLAALLTMVSMLRCTPEPVESQRMGLSDQQQHNVVSRWTGWESRALFIMRESKNGGE